MFRLYGKYLGKSVNALTAADIKTIEAMMVKQKPFKVYDFKSIEASIYSGQFECVEYLKETFKKEPKKFHARWRCQKNTTEELTARENGIGTVRRRTLETAARFAHRRKGFGQDVVERFAGFEAGAELRRLRLQCGIVQRLHRRFKGVDLIDDLADRGDITVVGRAEQALGEARKHRIFLGM